MNAKLCIKKQFPAICFPNECDNVEEYDLFILPEFNIRFADHRLAVESSKSLQCVLLTIKVHMSTTPLEQKEAI